MRTLLSRLFALFFSVVVTATSSLPAVATDLDVVSAFPEAVRFRAEFGLRSDAVFIGQMERDATADRTFGVALTDAEMGEMRRRVAVELGLGPVARYLSSIPSWAGSRMDQAGGHVYEILLTDPSAIDTRQMEALLPAGTQYRIRKVSRSMEDLQSLQARIDSDLAWFRIIGVQPTTTAIDVESNRVEIGVVSLSPAARAEIEQRYGADRLSLYEAGVGRLTACNSRNDCHTPLRGGIQLFDSGCSNAFFVSKNGAYYTLSAGHCYINSSYQYQHPNNNAPNVGRMTAEIYFNGTNADAGIVEIAAAQRSRRVYITKTSYYPMLSVQGRGWGNGETQDMTVCMSGWKRGEGTSCGQLKRIDVTFYGCQGPVDANGNCVSGIFVQQVNQRSATYTVAIGDSGGAVFTSNVAVGIQSGHDQGTDRAIYSHLTYALSGLGVTLCTSCP